MKQRYPSAYRMSDDVSIDAMLSDQTPASGTIEDCDGTGLRGYGGFDLPLHGLPQEIWDAELNHIGNVSVGYATCDRLDQDA